MKDKIFGGGAPTSVPGDEDDDDDDDDDEDDEDDEDESEAEAEVGNIQALRNGLILHEVWYIYQYMHIYIYIRCT